MPNVETNLTKPFPVVFSGHTLKYEIECICKIFLPIRKFTFLYDTAQLPEDAEEGAVLTLEQQGSQSRFLSGCSTWERRWSRSSFSGLFAGNR
ncbi:MAG: hypothetical protein ACLUOF_03535 [Ruminococcus sp.]